MKMVPSGGESEVAKHVAPSEERAEFSAFSFGLAFGFFWLLGDVGWRLFGDTANDAPSALLVGSPFPLLLGFLTWAIGKLLGLTDISSYLWRNDGCGKGSLALLTALLICPVLLTVGPPLHVMFASDIRTPLYAGIVAQILFLFVFVLAVAFLRPLLPFLIRIAKRTRPGSIAITSLGILIALLTVTYFESQRFADSLPWIYAFPPLFALAIVIGAAPFLKQWGRSQGRLVFLGLLLVATAAGLAAPLPVASAVQRSVEHPGVAHLVAKVLSTTVDVDGDGASGLYGSGDCSPFNPRVFAGALEIPNNGVDEDCDGQDFRADGPSLHVPLETHPRPKNQANKPHIFLITTDSLSLSRTGIGGASPQVTPSLDEWSTRATNFSSAFSASNATHSALPALLSGVLASSVPQVQQGQSPSPFFVQPEVMLPRLLQKMGYNTVALMGDQSFSEKAWPSLAGLFKIFSLDEYTKAKELEPQGAVHAAPFLTARALEILEENRSQPLFLWVHYFDHHSPYTPRREWVTDINASKTPADRFDQELRFADQHWGRLLRAIEKRFSPSEYVTIFTADHGEAFDRNHPVMRHKKSLHTEELHVPFLIQASGGRGRNVEGLVSHLDLVPTLGNLVNFSSKLKWEGESLVPVLFHAASPEKRAVYSLFYRAHAVRSGDDPFRQLGVRTTSHYLFRSLRDQRTMLTRWREDPFEEHNLAKSEKKQLQRLNYYLSQKLKTLRQDQRNFVHQVD